MAGAPKPKSALAAKVDAKLVLRAIRAWPRRKTGGSGMSLALVVDQEGWLGPKAAGGSRWQVTFERPDGRRVRLEVGQDRWERIQVGEIGWLDVDEGRLCDFHVVLGVQPSPQG